MHTPASVHGEQCNGFGNDSSLTRIVSIEDTGPTSGERRQRVERFLVKSTLRCGSRSLHTRVGAFGICAICISKERRGISNGRLDDVISVVGTPLWSKAAAKMSETRLNRKRGRRFHLGNTTAGHSQHLLIRMHRICQRGMQMADRFCGGGF